MIPFHGVFRVRQMGDFFAPGSNAGGGFGLGVIHAAVLCFGKCPAGICFFLGDGLGHAKSVQFFWRLFHSCIQYPICS